MPKYYSPKGNLEIWREKPNGYYTVDEWEKLYPHIPSEPTTDEKIVGLDAQYNINKAELLTAYQTAQVYGDIDTMKSLKADLSTLDEQYDEDYEKIIGGE